MMKFEPILSLYTSNKTDLANAWDGYLTTYIAFKCDESRESGKEVVLNIPSTPILYLKDSIYISTN